MSEPMKPHRLQPGMTIGVALPSSPVREDAFERGIAKIEARGYRVMLGDHARDSHGYLAGNNPDRAADLNAMFSNPDVHARSEEHTSELQSRGLISYAV